MHHHFIQLADRITRLIRFHRSKSTGAPPEDFERLAIDVFNAQFHHNPAYQTWCRARNITPESNPHWHQIPAVPTGLFKETLFSSIPPDERTAEFRSSGTTTQQPSRHAHFPASLALYRESALAHFERHLLGDLDDLVEAGQLGSLDKPAFLSLTPSPDAAPHSSLARMLGDILETFGSRDSLFTGRPDPDGAWEIDFDRLMWALRRSMCANRPVFLLGTAFNVVHLLDHFARGNIRYRLAAGSRLMETGGYKGRSRELSRSALHQEVQRHLGLPPTGIVTEYGMSELSSQAYDRIAAPLADGSFLPPIFTFPPWARATVVSPESGLEMAEGQHGLLKVVDLANLWSVTAILTGDEAIRRGDRFELVGRVPHAEPRGCSRMSL
jgi:hypothetical protein